MVTDLLLRNNERSMIKRRNLFLLGIPSAALTLAAAVLVGIYLFGYCCQETPRALVAAATVAGPDAGIGEPFGIAVSGSSIYVSDGVHGQIWRITSGSPPAVFALGLNIPSAIAFDERGSIIVAETGSHTIKQIGPDGRVSLVAGAENEPGDTDGPALSARFNAPVGLAVLDDGSIAVADTYNDKIKLIKDGSVITLAGSTRGFADGIGSNARFDTPCGIAPWKGGSILVADTLNSRIRMVSPLGAVTTVSGNGDVEARDGTLFGSAFYRPYSIAVGGDGSIYIGDGNAVRAIRNRVFPIVETLTKRQRGFADGPLAAAKFDRISGIAVGTNAMLFIADSGNAAVRSVENGPASNSRLPPYIEHVSRSDPAEFRKRQPGRWPYDPPDARRDIAGTLGEIRGELKDKDSEVWFHNGLDIAGSYGEKARFIRDEKVLDPVSAENFGTLRELLRMPSVGYIHIRLGRDSDQKPLGDARFQFDPGMKGVRVRRGTTFKAGEVLGTLNPMNHVHLIAGPSGDEMNALDALVLPNVIDTTPPVIEGAELFDQNWLPVETKSSGGRITLTQRTRIVVRAFDRMDGNPERRRLGVFKLGYQVLDRNRSPVADVAWNISFDRNPPRQAVKFAYAAGSRSGATGETIFRYTVTNRVSNDGYGEGYFEPSDLAPGEYSLRVFASDYFGNTASRDIEIEVVK